MQFSKAYAVYVYIYIYIYIYIIDLYKATASQCPSKRWQDCRANLGLQHIMQICYSVICLLQLSSKRQSNKTAVFLFQNSLKNLDSSSETSDFFDSPGLKGHNELLPYQCVRVQCMLCVVHHPPTTEINIFKHLFYKNTGPTVLKFHLEHDLPSGSQNSKTGSCGIS